MSEPEPVLEFALILTTAVASTIAGWVAGRRVPRKRGLLASIGFTLVAWPILCSLLPDRLYFLYPAFPFGESLFGTAFFLPGVLARTYADTSLRRILQGVLAAAVAYFVLAAPLWFLFHGESLRQVRGETRDGVTIQTEYYTCMPSSLATVLRRWGYDVTEGEAAYRLRTTFQGTNPTRVPRVVREMGEKDALRARIVDTSLEELARMERPAILVGWSGSVRHAVALLELDETRVGIGDPLRGMVRVPRGDLAREFRWSGLAIVIDAERPDAGGPTLRRLGQREDASDPAK